MAVLPARPRVLREDRYDGCREAFRRMNLVELLHRVIPPVLRSGEMIAEEFHRPGGPRGSGDKAPVDTEIEVFLCDALRAALPAPFVGEETPPTLDGDPRFCWLVDPHDGTSEFLRGARGSSVSVALMRDRVPVLGVVHAPLGADRGSDLIAWAEGLDHLLRNGAAIRPHPEDAGLGADEIVLLSYRSYARPETNARRVAPARFMSSNSIAYRLARAAAGDGVATVSRQSRLAAYDYAGGHALLRGAGCVFVDGAGEAPVYGPDGGGGMDKCFAGTAAAVRALLGHDWSLGDPPEAPIPERTTLAWPRSDRGLDRAIGCLAGLAIGEGPGPDGLPGQPGPAMEDAILLARDLVAGRTRTPRGVASLAPLGITRAALPRLPDLPPSARAFVAAIAGGIAGGSRSDMARVALDAARAADGDRAVLRALETASAEDSPADLAGGLFHLARGTPLSSIAGRGGVAGALIGAAEGRAALPDRAFRSVLSCRALASQGAPRPRPPEYWADDLPALAEALLARA